MKMPREVPICTLWACALWVTATTTFLFGLVDAARLGRDTITPTMGAGIFLAITALATTNAALAHWVTKTSHRSVDDIAHIMATLTSDQSRVPRIR